MNKILKISVVANSAFMVSMLIQLIAYMVFTGKTSGKAPYWIDAQFKIMLFAWVLIVLMAVVINFKTIKEETIKFINTKN